MPIAVAIKEVQYGSRWTNRVAKITLSGSYPTGGDTLDITPSVVTNPSGQDGAKQYAGVPDVIYPISDSGGYYFEIIPASPAATNTYKLKCYQPSGSEVAAGAYPAALSAPACDLLIEFTHKTLH